MTPKKSTTISSSTLPVTTSPPINSMPSLVEVEVKIINFQEHSVFRRLTFWYSFVKIVWAFSEQSSRCKINIAPNANPSYHLRIGSDATDTMIVNGKLKTVTGENCILIHLSIVIIKFRKKCRILCGLFYPCKKKCFKSNSWRHPSWHSKISLAGFATWCVWPPMWRFRDGHKIR